MNSRCLAIFVVLCSATLPCAFAAGQQDPQTCAQTSTPTPAVAACTRIINDNAEKRFSKELAVVYYHRSNAYLALGRRHEAFADFTEAIRLDAKKISGLLRDDFSGPCWPNLDLDFDLHCF